MFFSGQISHMYKNPRQCCPAQANFTIPLLRQYTHVWSPSWVSWGVRTTETGLLIPHPGIRITEFIALKKMATLQILIYVFNIQFFLKFRYTEFDISSSIYRCKKKEKRKKKKEKRKKKKEKRKKKKEKRTGNRLVSCFRAVSSKILFLFKINWAVLSKGFNLQTTKSNINNFLPY